MHPTALQAVGDVGVDGGQVDVGEVVGELRGGIPVPRWTGRARWPRRRRAGRPRRVWRFEPPLRDDLESKRFPEHRLDHRPQGRSVACRTSGTVVGAASGLFTMSASSSHTPTHRLGDGLQLLHQRPELAHPDRRPVVGGPLPSSTRPSTPAATAALATAGTRRGCAVACDGSATTGRCRRQLDHRHVDLEPRREPASNVRIPDSHRITRPFP